MTIENKSHLFHKLEIKDFSHHKTISPECPSLFTRPEKLEYVENSIKCNKCMSIFNEGQEFIRKEEEKLKEKAAEDEEKSKEKREKFLQDYYKSIEGYKKLLKKHGYTMVEGNKILDDLGISKEKRRERAVLMSNKRNLLAQKEKKDIRDKEIIVKQKSYVPTINAVYSQSKVIFPNIS